ncbi:MAG: thiamine phosphate synthase [Ahrensia sp.]|nr:thiamine phosphate synthase [Ahrensia sp.]
MTTCDISLYAILDPARTRDRPLAQMASAAARGGATILQYRDKSADTRTLIDNARTIREALAPYDIPLLINDRVDVALAVGAAGVHVGQCDMAPLDARRLLGDDAIIGLTIKTQDHARAAPTELLDYVCIGGVFDTLSKENRQSIGLDGWRDVAQHFRTAAPKMPVGAIAGIDADNVVSVLDAGADGVAIISAIFMADDVEAATRHLRKAVEEAQK